MEALVYICICMYVCISLHPSPLKSSEQATTNKQATSKQAFLLSVLAIAQSHRSGLYSTLAIPEPRWWPCQIQVLSQKPTRMAVVGLFMLFSRLFF